MSNAVTTDPAAPRVEERVPLSSSTLWLWMKQYYRDGGVAVWTGGDIPFHITNTPVLAAQWASAIFELLRDFQRLGQLDPRAPIEIVELGPGTGRHAFYLLRELARVERDTRLLHPEGYRLVLRLAELGEKGLANLERHPQLQPYLATGRLQLSRFDIAEEEHPTPWPNAANAPAAPSPSPNPIFVIANYVLDSLPHDVLRMVEGQGFLGLATIAVKGWQPDRDPRELSDLGERIELSFSYAASEVRFEHPDWNRVLDHYRALDDTHLPFPTGAMTFLERLRRWSQQAAVLLVADKSFVSLEQFRSLEEPELVPHGGGFSFNANVHTLGLLAEQWQGHAWHTSARDGTLDLSLLVVPSSQRPSAGPFPEVERHWEEVERFHAIDRFRLKESIDEVVRRPNLRLSLDLLRLSGYDPQVFYELSDHMLRGLDSAETTEEAEAELRRVLEPCLDAVFPVGDDVDSVFEIGRLAYRLEMYALSERAFRLSMEQFGPDPRANFNLGLGWYYQDRLAEAEAAFEKAFQLDANYVDAQEWLKKTQRRRRALDSAGPGKIAP